MTDMPMSVEPIAGAQPASKAPWDPPQVTATPIAQATSATSGEAPQTCAKPPPSLRRKWGITGDGWHGFPVG